jgi:hypothetical protein
MKRIFLMVAFIASAFLQTGFAQTEDVKAPALLPLYYDVKDALVAGNSSIAASKAGDLVKALSSSDVPATMKSDQDEILEHASKIAGSKDLKSQRAHFAGLSTNMIALAKNLKLSTEPVYQMYCPMKKSNWLSSDKAVKNPYYGSAMLTCGNIVDTIK